MTLNQAGRFFILRPALSWSLSTAALLLAAVFTVSWTINVEETSFKDLTDFPLVPLSIAPEQAMPEMDLSDAVSDIQEQEKPLSFGAIDKSYQNIANAATAPRPRFSTLPSYPDSMRHEGVEGTVMIELGIDETGRVVYGKIVNSLGKKFDNIVIKWARGIFFYPARTLEGKPFKCRIQLPVNFKLDS